MDAVLSVMHWIADVFVEPNDAASLNPALLEQWVQSRSSSSLNIILSIRNKYPIVGIISVEDRKTEKKDSLTVRRMKAHRTGEQTTRQQTIS
jgi:hypothetical protein